MIKVVGNLHFMYTTLRSKLLRNIFMSKTSINLKKLDFYVSKVW